MLGDAILLAEVTRHDSDRGLDVVESQHVGHLVVVRGGEVVVAAGEPDHPTFLRSSIKPFQATACLEALAEHGLPGGELGDDEVAIGWASHTAEDRHLDAVRRLLARSGLSPDQLTCPPDVRPAEPGGARARIHHNCSGKHALFALAGAALGDAGPALLDPRSELQRRVLAAIADGVGGRLGLGVDGCGAPAVVTSLAGLAEGFAAIAAGGRWAVVRDAGFANPWLVGGEGRLESHLLAGGTVAKVGAEGVYGAGWVGPDGVEVGLAVKCLDGSVRGAQAALFALAVAAGRDLTGFSPPAVVGGSGIVGAVRASPVVAAAASTLAN